MSNSVWPHRWQPTRLPRPWDSPVKNTGVGRHFLLQCMKVNSESEVAGDPMDCSLLGSSVHGVFQARVLEWGAIAFSDIKYYIVFIDSSTIENIHLLSDVQIVFYLIPLSSLLYNVWDCIFILFFYSLWIIVTIIINFMSLWFSVFRAKILLVEKQKYFLSFDHAMLC